MTISRVLTLVAFLACSQGGLHAQTEEPPPPATWQEAACQDGLSNEDIASLEKNRVLIADVAYRQIFSAYLGGDKPLFITSDSLLNAYHVLYEESILRLETAMSGRLPGILQLVLANLRKTTLALKAEPEVLAAAKERATLIPAIALRLMDDSFRLGDDRLDAIVKEETGRIIAGTGTSMPKWLGRSDPTFIALDYSRYRPRGFYTRSDALKRYFRAVSWLQSIPFRVSNDEELLAILLLGKSISFDGLNDWDKYRDIKRFFHAYRSFIGAGDDWDLFAAAEEGATALQTEPRKWLSEVADRHGEGPRVNDQIRFAPEDPTKVAEPQFRIISAYRTPSSLLFQRTTDPRKFKRDFPDGLEVASALGSAFARKNLSGPDKPKLLDTIDACKPFFQGDRLYLRYMDALRALLDDPEPDAPDFMKGEAWAAKSCNTVLAGWAQLTHTWVLQVKMAMYFGGGAIVPAGFVEPEPEFFSRMADLAAATREQLKESGAFAIRYGDAIEAIVKLRVLIDGVEDQKQLDEKLQQLPAEDMIATLLPLTLVRMRPAGDTGSDIPPRKMTENLDAILADIRSGRIDKRPEIKAILDEHETNIEILWTTFELTCRRLESISHKQLRGVELNASETDFIKSYGETCAHIMLYGYNSYLTPWDDAPRIVDVYANPQVGGYRHVGTARPRRIYVLYPWHGKTILCQGGILPYYEFVTPQRLTDKDWKERLDSPQLPPIPKWIAPVVSGGRLGSPKLQEEH